MAFKSINVLTSRKLKDLKKYIFFYLQEFFYFSNRLKSLRRSLNYLKE